MPPQSRRKDRRLDERWSKDTADGSRFYGFGFSANRGPLYSAAVPIYIRHAERVGVLYCVECGCCSGELGKGWVALTCNDPDGADEPRIVVYCPPCAAAELGYRPDIAANYVCAWEPLPRETTDSLGGVPSEER